MAIRVTLECGHASMLRVRTTPEGYTHDWEVFVRGVDNADISQFIDKVVFNLHETFQKPKRILKEPPYMVKESGYAGFEIPIDVYLKNKDDPKRIQIQYDLHLQQSGPAINNVTRHNEVFVNPSEEFRKKLLKGGGALVSHSEDSAEKGEFKMVPPMVSKPKLSGTDAKKHRMTEVRSSDEFSDLFGNIMTLPAKVSPENKRALTDKIISSKGSVEKSEKTEKSVKQKHSPHKDKKKDKNSDERKEKKDRLLSKEKDRLKEKSKRSQSPVSKEDFSNANVKKNSLPSPAKKHLAAPVPASTQKPPSPRPKEKQHKQKSADKEKEKNVKENFKVPVEEQTFDRKKKKHKEDKNKDRKEREKDKDHDKIKDPSKGADKKSVKPEKHEKSDKDKSLESSKSSKEDKKSPKHSKDKDKIRSEKSSRSESVDKIKEPHSDREKQKHKHKRKDKKEKKEENSEKEKQEKQKISSEKKNSFASLTSANPLSTLLAEMPERDSSDSTHSVDEDPIPAAKNFFTPASETEVASNPALSSDITKLPSPRTNNEAKNEGDERTKKEKTKSSRGEDREIRKRKRKADSGPDEHVAKREKEREPSLSPSVEPVSSSQSPVSMEISSPYVAKETAPAQPEIVNITESEQVAPDSTNSNFNETEGESAALVFSEDYVSQLKELQQKIMTLQDNQELQRVVQVIAETGQYEITRKTFDFDLCALDRTTVQRLQQFFSAS